MSVFDVSEADEGAPTRAAALANLAEQVRKVETPSVVEMYERAALSAGATHAEVADATSAARPGPCHALGGAHHRCDGPPSITVVAYGRSGRCAAFRFCARARRELRELADAHEVPVTLEVR